MLAGYTENYRKVINYHEVMQLKDRLKKIPLLFHYIDSHSKEAYGTAIGYLTQEGLLEPVSYALVDSGWIGTIQRWNIVPDSLRRTKMSWYPALRHWQEGSSGRPAGLPRAAAKPQRHFLIRP